MIIAMTNTGASPVQEKTSVSAAAFRMRRHRARRKGNLRCLTIELRETEVGSLIRKGYLESEMRNDLSAVRSALYAFLDTALGA
jgi:hypothetical protein